METARRPVEHKKRQGQSPDSRQSGKRADWLNIGLTSAVMLAWLLAVKALEGLDGDTTFLAIFCGVLSLFIIKSIAAGLRREKY
jgi:hypothetical protein